MVNTDQIAKIIEEALTKQKEIFKFEMEMAMQEMRQMHDQQIRTLSNQLGESSRRSTANQAGSDSDVDERLNPDNPPVNQNAGGDPTKNNDAGGGPVIPLKNRPKPDMSENEKMKDLESKINALMSV